MATDFQLLDNLLNTNPINDFINISKDNCPHNNTMTEGSITMCIDCGFEIKKSNIDCIKKEGKTSYDPTRCYMRRIDDRSIYKDVIGMGFSEEIINIANNLYEQVTNGKVSRGKSRKAIIFACIFHAYKMNGMPQSCESLIDTFGLNKKVGLKGFKHVNLYAPKNSPIRKTTIDTTTIIEEILNKFNVSTKNKKEVYDMYDKIKNNSIIVIRSRPNSVASSLVYIWAHRKGMNIHIKDFARETNLSELTISKISKEIEAILNKLEGTSN